VVSSSSNIAAVAVCRQERAAEEVWLVISRGWPGLLLCQRAARLVNGSSGRKKGLMLHVVVSIPGTSFGVGSLQSGKRQPGRHGLDIGLHA
jgi:hypothetical protein